MYAVLAGAVSLEAAGGPPVTAGPGDTVGVHETLAGAAVESRAVVTANGRALRIDGEELFDLLGQRPALLQQLFGALFRRPRASEEVAAT
jgi:hypothetical protein